jgi:diamine N-acetyltransferase
MFARDLRANIFKSGIAGLLRKRLASGEMGVFLCIAVLEYTCENLPMIGNYAAMETEMENSRKIHFKRITASTVAAICQLSETLSPVQRTMVTDNAKSIAQAHFSEKAWMRAINVEETPVGFIMLHFGSDYDDGIDCHGAFLWRLMIAGPHQGNGYGKQAVDFLVMHLKSQGYRELYTCCGQGEGSPEGFYRKYGFVSTGDYYGDEIELVYCFGS